jgi:hypothetical protein
MAAMRHLALVLSTLWIVLFLSAHSCLAEAPLRTALLCRNAIAAAETARHVPDAFLSAIAKVESGRLIAGMVVPWPWTINAEGAGSFFATKDDAIAAVQALQARGVRSIDVGCMQVNLLQHPDAFRALDQAFDPTANAQYAAALLVSLFGQMGSWPLAAAAYHSQTPTIGAAYQKQVLAAWAMPDRPGPQSAKAHALAAAGTKPGAPQSSPAPAMRMAGAQGFSAFGRQLAPLSGEQPHGSLVHGAGRGLDAYRQMPVRLAFRAPARPG